MRTRHPKYPRKVNILGMELDEWRYKSCIAHFGVGDTWATLFDIESSDEGKGHATHLLLEANNYYQAQFKKVGGSVALNNRMSELYKRVGYPEYNNEYMEKHPEVAELV